MKGNLDNKNKFDNMVSEIESKFGYQPYEYLSDPYEYQNKKSYVTLKCKKCSYVFDYKPMEILRPRVLNPVCKNCTTIKNNLLKLERGREQFFDFLETAYPGIYTYNKNDYNGNSSNMTFKCNCCDSTFQATPSNIKNNARLNRSHYCKTCSFKNLSDSKLNLDSFKSKLDVKFDNSYDIIQYNGYSKESTFKCKLCNTEFDYVSNSLLSSKHRYCPSCSHAFKHDKRDYFERCFLESNGKIVPIGKFTNMKTKILHKCTKCDHEWESTPGNIVTNHTGCPKCANTYIVSKGEKELVQFIRDNYSGVIETNTRKVISPKELDIYLPELNLAIEYCGLYWHNEGHKGKNYHREKLDACTDKGIRLVTLFEDEWLNNNDLVKNKILHLLRQNKCTKINARKCVVKEIGKLECDSLLNRNHLQGSDRAAIRLGLFHNDELVAAMTFCRPRVSLGFTSGQTKYDYELSRFVTNTKYIVNGSFSKLFSYFKKNYEWNEIITYADLRWSNGDVYVKNNFNISHISKPNYFYVDRNDGTKRIHRFMYRKSAIKTKHPEIYNEALTEREMTAMLDLYRIYDCGNKVFTYKK